MKVPPQPSADQTLRAENAVLRARLGEAEETLRAIRAGEVDALVVEGDAGPQIFTLQGLEAEQSRFRGEILARVSDAVVGTDTEDRITFLNAAAECRYGVRADDVLGCELKELYTRRWPSPEAEAAMWTASSERGEWRGELIHRTFDGRDLHVETCVTALRLPNGERNGMVAAIRDVTERKRLEEEKSEALRLLDTLLTHAPVGFVFLDLDLRFVRINERLAEINGFSVAAHLGRTVAEIVPTLETALGEVTASILATGQPVLNHEFTGETASAPGVTRYWSQSWYPVHDAGGEIMGFGAVVEEITERKQAQRALADRTELLNGVLEGTTDVIFVKDLNGRVMLANAACAAMFNSNPEQMVGKTTGELCAPDMAAAMLQHDKDVLASRSPVQCEETVSVAGDPREFLTLKAPLRDGGGGVVGVLGISRDITDRKRAETQLRRLATELSDADRCKDEFLATLAHELRNPLAPIRAGLHIIKLAGGNPGLVKESVVIMERQVGQMTHLIDDLMDLSRISSGKIVLKKTRLSLANVVQDAVDTTRPLIEERGHNLVVDMPPEPIYVDADRTRLAQVFGNLLNNAAKYTDTGGRIRVAIERQGGEVVVAVEDNGVGISATMLTCVFDMFSQVDRSLEKSQGGLGIGLNIVKRLAEMHDGSIVAQSGGHGAGSRFVLRLPIALSLNAEQHDEEAKCVAVPARCRILVVDDNRDAANSLALVLKLMGHELQTAYDGFEALDVAALFRPDLVLLDIGMPKLNGYDTARRMREQSWGKGMVLVALTGWGQEEDKRKSEEASFDEHLVKPVDPAVLDKLLGGLKKPAVSP